MALDFTTLYVVILLNSLMLAIVWGVVYRAYDRFEAAGIWMAACLTTALGGCVLATEALFGTMVSIFIGNALVIFGFCLFWIGIRRFQERKLPWLASIALTLGAMALLAVFTFVSPNGGVRNVIYAVAQSAPLAASIIDLLRQPRRRAGTWLAATGMALGILVHAIETSGNGLQAVGIISAGAYAIIEPAVVLLVVFNGMLWNVGLLLMVVDRLYAALTALALHDELTGLLNRRALVDRLQEQIVGAQAGNASFALLVIDLDNFKDINDSYGHLAGDACLVHVAATLQDALCPGDRLARTGGDEFCAILPGVDSGEAGQAAARLVAAMRAAPLRWNQRTLYLTLSIGAASWRPGQTGDMINAAADAALYQAKARGRNRHVVSGQGFVADPAEPSGELASASAMDSLAAAPSGD